MSGLCDSPPRLSADALRTIRNLKKAVWQESLMLRFFVHIPREGWRDVAACRGMDHELFYDSTVAADKVAETICNTCPVMMDCGAQALIEEANENHRYGIRAGLGPITRMKLARTLQ